MLDLLSSLLKALFLTLCGIAFLLSLPFVVAHVVDTWYAPQYPHSGFSPECPEWIDPLEDSLPPCLD